MNISDILKKITGPDGTTAINEETAKVIAEAFDGAVKEKANTQVSLEVENAVAKLDKDHTSKLKTLLEKIDVDHTNKLKKVVQTITENHTNKLKTIVDKYRKTINEKATEFSDTLVGKISNYLDLYLEKAIPAAQLEEAVSNNYAKKQLGQIRKFLAIDPEQLNESVKGTIENGRKKIDELQAQLNEAYKENLVLAESNKKSKSSVILEQKTKGMNSAKKTYLTKILSDKDPEYISENFNYVVEMFEREESSEAEQLVEEAVSGSKTRDAVVPKAEPRKTPDRPDGQVTGYLSELQSIDKKF
jgi:hypothetical protein